MPRFMVLCHELWLGGTGCVSTYISLESLLDMFNGCYRGSWSFVEQFSHLFLWEIAFICISLHVLIISLAFLRQILWFWYHIVTYTLCDFIGPQCMLLRPKSQSDNQDTHIIECFQQTNISTVVLSLW